MIFLYIVKYDVACIGANNLGRIISSMDALFAAHLDFKSYTSYGNVFRLCLMLSDLTKQKLNTKLLIKLCK